MHSQIKVVREALQKIDAQGEIGTVNIKRCIDYLTSAEDRARKQEEAIAAFRAHVMGLDD